MSENNDLTDDPIQSSPRLWLVILPFIIMAVLAIFLYPAFRDLALWISSYRWAVTEGQLEEVDVETILVGEVATESRPNVLYSYSVDDEDYIGTRLYFGNEPNAYSGWEILIGLAVDSYRNVSTVNVYYNPDDPSQSVIERRVGIERGYQWIFVAIIFIVLVAYVVTFFQMILAIIKKPFTRGS